MGNSSRVFTDYKNYLPALNSLVTAASVWSEIYWAVVVKEKAASSSKAEIVVCQSHKYTRQYLSRPVSRWPRDLRRRSATARLLRLWVRIPLGAWMFVCCECCESSCRDICDELITRPEESY